MKTVMHLFPFQLHSVQLIRLVTGFSRKTGRSLILKLVLLRDDKCLIELSVACNVSSWWGGVADEGSLVRSESVARASLDSPLHCHRAVDPLRSEIPPSTGRDIMRLRATTAKRYLIAITFFLLFTLLSLDGSFH